MEGTGPLAHEVVFGTGRAEIGAAVEQALRDSGIPFQMGIQATPEPRMVFTVPGARLQEAQDVVARCLASGAGQTAPIDDDLRNAPPLAAGRHAGPRGGQASESGREASPARRQASEETGAYYDETEEDAEYEEALAERARLQADGIRDAPPWKTIGACSVLVLFHLAIVLGFGGARVSTRRLVDLGALVDGRTLREPWRLVTSLFLHVDLAHVLWNGLSLVVFAVPLVATLGRSLTAGIYLMSGVAGGLAASAMNPEGTVTVGSSGAVAGLFGAWLVGALERVWSAPGPSRARLRVLGVGLLILPSLVTPTTADGKRISVAAHLGGALAGVVLGLLVRRREELPDLAESESN